MLDSLVNVLIYFCVCSDIYWIINKWRAATERHRPEHTIYMCERQRGEWWPAPSKSNRMNRNCRVVSDLLREFVWINVRCVCCGCGLNLCAFIQIDSQRICVLFFLFCYVFCSGDVKHIILGMHTKWHYENEFFLYSSSLHSSIDFESYNNLFYSIP